jgi:hypothetical protein
VKRPLFQQASQTRSGPPRTTLRGKGTDKSGPHGLDFPYAKPQYNPKVTTNAAALLSAWLVASHHRCLLHPLFHPRHSRSPTVCEHGPAWGPHLRRQLRLCPVAPAVRLESDAIQGPAHTLLVCGCGGWPYVRLPGK